VAFRLLAFFIENEDYYYEAKKIYIGSFIIFFAMLFMFAVNNVAVKERKDQEDFIYNNLLKVANNLENSKNYSDAKILYEALVKFPSLDKSSLDKIQQHLKFVTLFIEKTE
jgi:hypothetical protein